jgi:hypothetical protein
VVYADRAPQPADTPWAGQLFGEDRASALNIATLVVPIPGREAATIHVKFRPHVHEFLHEAHKLFELHIYTMGDRCYADLINKCVAHGARCIVRRCARVLLLLFVLCIACILFLGARDAASSRVTGNHLLPMFMLSACTSAALLNVAGCHRRMPLGLSPPLPEYIVY